MINPTGRFCSFDFRDRNLDQTVWLALSTPRVRRRPADRPAALRRQGGQIKSVLRLGTRTCKPINERTLTRPTARERAYNSHMEHTRAETPTIAVIYVSPWYHHLPLSEFRAILLTSAPARCYEILENGSAS